MSGLINVIIIFFIFSARVGAQGIIYSNDTMSLSLSSNTRNLMDVTATLHSLEFILKNNGGAGTFLIHQTSPHGVQGRLSAQTLFLNTGQMVTITVDHIRLPSLAPLNSVFSLSVKKRNPGPEESQHSAPGYRDAVRSTVILNLVAGTIQEETGRPLSSIWLSEAAACYLVDTCGLAHWLASFSAQDTGSGMFRIQMKSFQSSHDLYWWHDAFSVGTVTEVRGGVWASCCSEVVELEVEDVAGNKERRVLGRDTGPRWNIVLPIVAGVAATTVIIIIFITVCACRHRYSSINTQTQYV